ncbi:MAG: gamma-glutamyltransferase [Betaproteobacteria bacterium]|nr:gamma-glutamyltransferase [Betaproteobacteria bacterium]
MAVTTAHPLASQAALQVLEQGGAPIDAAIAAQMVLGLVEPQSSGIGGGALIMHWDAASRRLTSYDGLAAAPARVTAALSVDVDGATLKSEDVQRGGRSVGVPGALAVLREAHDRHGRLPWADLFRPAIALAESGFPLPRYMHTILSLPTAAADHPDMVPLYFGPDGKVRDIGSTVTHPRYAATLKRIAALGPAGLWADGGGAAFIASAQRGVRGTLMTEADLAAYRAQPRDPLCAQFLVYTVCMMAPPSFGGVVVLQMLQMLDARPASGDPARRFDFDDPEFAHYYAEAGRLAQADRLHHVGDPDFVSVPTAALVAKDYVRERAARISPTRMTPDVEAGGVERRAPARAAVSPPPAGEAESADATSQLAVVDSKGNALSMTTTINLNFGSRLMADGFVLNNALTNFTGALRAGQPAANRMQPGKRPVTSMAPTIVFDAAGQPVAVGGSAGGGQIVDYIASTLVEMLANGRTPAEALARGHVSTAVRGKLQLEKGTPAAAQADALKAKGHDVDVLPMISGLGFLLRKGEGWLGAADPRRDGVALGR